MCHFLIENKLRVYYLAFNQFLGLLLIKPRINFWVRFSQNLKLDIIIILLMMINAEKNSEFPTFWTNS